MSPPIRVSTVLVVDDEAAMRALMRRILEGVGYQVYEAADGVEALAGLARRGPADVIVTDIRMPHMDGHELGRRLATQYPITPILFISGYDFEPDLPGPVLAKPFRVEDLTERLGRLLAREPQGA